MYPCCNGMRMVLDFWVFLPEIHNPSLIVRKRQANPDWGTLCKIPDQCSWKMSRSKARTVWDNVSMKRGLGRQDHFTWYDVLDGIQEQKMEMEAKLRKSEVTWSCPTLCDPIERAGLLCPWDSPGKNTGVGGHFLLQGIFPTQGSNPHLLHCRQIIYHCTICEALKEFIKSQRRSYVLLGKYLQRGNRPVSCSCPSGLQPIPHTCPWHLSVWAETRLLSGMKPCKCSEGWNFEEVEIFESWRTFESPFGSLYPDHSPSLDVKHVLRLTTMWLSRQVCFALCFLSGWKQTFLGDLPDAVNARSIPPPSIVSVELRQGAGTGLSAAGNSLCGWLYWGGVLTALEKMEWRCLVFLGGM